MAISAEHRSNLQPFTCNGDVSKWMKNSRVGRKTANKHKKIFKANVDTKKEAGEYLYPREHRNHSVCLSVQIRVRPIIFLGPTLAFHNCHMGVSLWEDVSRTYDVDLWPQGQIYRVCVRLITFDWWYWLTIFGTCVYHHEFPIRHWSLTWRSN